MNCTSSVPRQRRTDRRPTAETRQVAARWVTLSWYQQVAEVIWHKAALPPHMDGSVVFTRWRHCPSPSSMCFLGPTRVHILSGILMVQLILHNSGQKVPIIYSGLPISPKHCPCMWEDLVPRVIHASLGQPQSASFTASESFHPFLHRSWRSPYTSKCAAPFPLKVATLHGGSGPPSNTWFLGPTRVNNRNAMSISSAIFAGLTVVTDWQTDNATPSVKIGSIYVCSTAYGRIWIWLRGPAVEHRSLAGVLSLSCARPVADGWPLNVGKPSL